LRSDGAQCRSSAKCRGGREPLHRPQACSLFDEIPVRDVVTCSAAIYRHARSGLFHESAELFVGMMRAGVCPNSFTLVGVLLAAAGLGDVVLAQCIHGWAAKSRLESNHFVSSALVDAYAKCGRPMNALAFFNDLRDPNVVSWNAMISGLVHNVLFVEAVFVFKRLCCCFGSVPNNAVTMINVAQAYAGCGDLGMCKSVHAYAVKAGFDLDVLVTNSILGMYLSFGDIEIGREIFRKNIVRNVVTWTMMMGFLLKQVHAGEVIMLFVQMRSNGIVPDRVAMVSLVQACALLGDARRGKMVHNQMITGGFSSELPAVNSLITMYSKCKDLSSARVLFDGMRKKSLVSWTAMVSGYIGSGRALEGMLLFGKMRHENNFVIDSVALVSLLTGCYETAKFDLCVQLHGYSYKSGLYLYRPVPNTFIAVYGKCGYAILAHKVFDDMISRDVVSWNTLILSYGINGQGEQAVALFNDMEESSEKRDSVTYLNAMLACSHSGQVDDGLIIFRRMIIEKRVNPCQEHIGCLVDMLARAGRLDEAAEVASLTSNEGANPWKALMGGGHLYSQTELTEVAAEKVLNADSFDNGHVVLLSNTCASAGKYSDAESIRSCYSKQTRKKILGLSSIEIMLSSTR
jgi:pentatricopeptide repeat protein